MEVSGWVREGLKSSGVSAQKPVKGNLVLGHLLETRFTSCSRLEIQISHPERAAVLATLSMCLSIYIPLKPLL